MIAAGFYVTYRVYPESRYLIPVPFRGNFFSMIMLAEGNFFDEKVVPDKFDILSYIVSFIAYFELLQYLPVST